MTYSYDSQTARNPKQDCATGGGRNSDLRLIDLIQDDDFSRKSVLKPEWRVLTDEDLERIADVMRVARKTPIEELRQMHRRGTVELEPIDDGDYRVRVK